MPKYKKLKSHTQTQQEKKTNTNQHMLTLKEVSPKLHKHHNQTWIKYVKKYHKLTKPTGHTIQKKNNSTDYTK